jgi:hypothetical protein
MIAAICDIDIVVFIDDDGPRPLKLALAFTALTYEVALLVVMVKDAYSMVPAIQDAQIIVAIQSQVFWKIEHRLLALLGDVPSHEVLVHPRMV